MKVRVPLEPDLAEDVFQFWHSIFPGDSDCPKDVLFGSEMEHNRNDIYLAQRDGEVVASCNTIRSMAVPQLGGFGEVATKPEYRGQGLATDLCRRALQDFGDDGGEALFLGTDNPAAARIYHRLGWRKLAGSNVMASIRSADSPEAFLVDYFHTLGNVTIRPIGPAQRVPMIPLLHTPHDWQVLDANVGMYSTRYDVQGSCNGLYRRYGYVMNGGRGICFVAVTDDGRVVGLSSARLLESDHCCVDGFVHQRFMSCCRELIQAAMRWGESQGATVLTARLSTEDEDKQQFFESLDFRKGNQAGEFELGGRKVDSVFWKTE